MRFIFKVVIGMIIFNALLFLFASTFATTGNQGKDIDATDSELGYKIDSDQFVYSLLLSGGGVFIIGGIAALITRNSIWVGVGALMAIIFGLWSAGSGNIGELFNEYPLANTLWNILNIIFGVIATIAVVEIFTGRSSDD